jgi:DNA-binding XRE family transcriptional regulator
MEGSSLVKVGKAKDPEQRLRDLQTGIPYRLKLLKVYPCEQVGIVEKRVHKTLAQQQHSGEWFDTDLEAVEEAFQQAISQEIPARIYVPVQKGFLGKRLARLRQDKEISQIDLARQVGITAKHLCQIENGKFSLESLRVRYVEALADILGVTMDYLLNRDTSKDNNDIPIRPRA